MISTTYQSKVEQSRVVGVFKRVLKMRLSYWNRVVLLKNMSSRSGLQMLVLAALGQQATRGKGTPPQLQASAVMVSLGPLGLS